MAEDGDNRKSRRGLRSQRREGLFLTLILLLNTLCMGTIGFFQYQAYQREKSRPSIHDIARSTMEPQRMLGVGSELIGDMGGEKKGEEDGILLPLNGFTANLAQDDGPRRYIRLNTVLKFSLDSEENEFRSRRPQIRDAIISILNAKKPSDLLKREGKNFLKEEIKSSINSFLVDGRVTDIYYVGFQIN